MPQYAALIWSTDLEPSDPAFAAMMPRYDAFTHEAEAVIRGGAALYNNATATTVRVQGGKGGDVVTTDGPYADTKEALTGFFLVEAADLDEAVTWASKIPAAWDGSGCVEVRPVLDVG